MELRHLRYFQMVAQELNLFGVPRSGSSWSRSR